MPTDAELRTLFQDAALPNAALPGRAIDAATIIRRSKHRRLPRQVGAGSVLTLAVAGIGVASFTGLRPLTATTTADSAAESSYDAPMGVSGAQPFLEDGSKRAAAEKLNLCGTEVAEVVPSASGLKLSTRFPETAAATGADVRGIVTLTNTGTETISGIVMADPVVTVSQGGITLWHSNSSAVMQSPIKLTPGESLDYETSFAPVLCSAENELGHTGLPPLPPGEYQLTAAIDFFPNDAPVDLISGPAAIILLK